MIAPDRRTQPLEAQGRPSRRASFFEFAELLGWQVRLLLRSAPRSAAAAVLLSGCSVLLQAGSIGSLLLFVRAQQNGGRAHVFGTDLPAHPDVVGLTTWGAAVLLLGTAAALLTQVGALRAQAAAAAGTRGYVAGVLAEVTRLAASASEHQPSAERFPPAAAADRSILIRAFVRDSAVLVRSLSFTLGLVLPLFTLALAAAVLARLDLWLAVGVALPLALLGLPYLALSRGLVKTARSYESLARRRTVLLSEIFANALEGRSPAVGAEELDHRLRSDRTLRDSERAIAAFMLRGDRVQALRTAYLAVALCGILVLFGVFRERNASWAALATFVVALRYAATSLGAVAGKLLGTVRFVPQLERMRAMESARNGEDWRRLLRERVEPAASELEPEADELE